MVVDDQTRPVLSRIPDEVMPTPRPPSQLFMIFIKESEVAAMTALYYTLQVLVSNLKTFGKSSKNFALSVKI